MHRLTSCRAVRPLPLAAALTGAVLLLPGCGQPPWDTGASGSTSASPTPSISASPSATATPVHNDLAKGSLRRKLTAGGVELAVNYWSTLDLANWTPAASKPVNLSATGSFADGSSQDIYLTSVSMATAVNGPAGALPAPATQTDQASVQPGYVITKPNSYGGVFTIPPVDAKATSVTVTFTYQLLQQTAPKAKTFSKQTAVDTLSVPLVRLSEAQPHAGRPPRPAPHWRRRPSSASSTAPSSRTRR